MLATRGVREGRHFAATNILGTKPRHRNAIIIIKHTVVARRKSCSEGPLLERPLQCPCIIIISSSSTNTTTSSSSSNSKGRWISSSKRASTTPSTSPCMWQAQLKHVQQVLQQQPQHLQTFPMQQVRKAMRLTNEQEEDAVQEEAERVQKCQRQQLACGLGDFSVILELHRGEFESAGDGQVFCLQCSRAERHRELVMLIKKDAVTLHVGTKKLQLRAKQKVQVAVGSLPTGCASTLKVLSCGSSTKSS